MLHSRGEYQIAVVIKALNEAKHIRASIASALAALEGLRGEVILADSGSTDGTLEIAADFPIRVVQLVNESDRSCGVGAQLGFQYVNAEYVYILDGDMELSPTFFRQALRYMGGEVALAGVAGLVEERGSGNYEFERRRQNNDGLLVGEVNYLEMGGLYRCSAIREVRYFTNRNLHSYEEKELGSRLRKAGYKLLRIDVPAVKHHGKTESTGALLWKRWRTKHLDGPGEWIRASASVADAMRLALGFRQLIVVLLLWIGVALGLIWIPLLLVSMLGLLSLFLVFLYRHMSVRKALTALLNISICAFALARGLLRIQKNPEGVIAARQVQPRND